MNKKIWSLCVAVLVAVPLIYGLMPGKQVDNSEQATIGNPSVSQSEPTDLFGLPEQIAGMQLQDLQTGQAAIQAVSGMHGVGIALKDACIATYQGDKQNAMIWVSISNNEKEAKDLFAIMDQKMPKSDSFTKYHSFTINGKEYRYVFWPKRNMHNYYFVKGVKNYWIAVGADEPMPILTEVLKKL